MFTHSEIANLAIGYGIGATRRVEDPNVRAIVRETIATHKRETMRDVERRANSFNGYAPENNCGNMHVHSQECKRDCKRAAICGTCRACQLKTIHWPRARVIKNALSVTRDMLKRHASRHDALTLSASEYDLACIRECRLSQLLSAVYARAASVGAFPISRHDMRTDVGTIFIRSAYKRHFTFKGGRDESTVQIEPADIVQGAVCRAIEAGDTVGGVPTFGAFFRHIQSERASLTRIELARRAAFMRVATGDVPADTDDWPEMTDRHAMRLIGTRNYPTLSQHRASLADAHRDSQIRAMHTYTTDLARGVALESATDTERALFSVQVATLIRDKGATLEMIASALNLSTESVRAKVFATLPAHLESGADHSTSSVAVARMAEREREIANAQSEHAATLRRKRLNAMIADYARTR